MQHPTHTHTRPTQHTMLRLLGSESALDGITHKTFVWLDGLLHTATTNIIIHTCMQKTYHTHHTYIAYHHTPVHAFTHEQGIHTHTYMHAYIFSRIHRYTCPYTQASSHSNITCHVHHVYTSVAYQMNALLSIHHQHTPFTSMHPFSLSSKHIQLHHAVLTHQFLLMHYNPST